MYCHFFDYCLSFHSLASTTTAIIVPASIQICIVTSIVLLSIQARHFTGVELHITVTYTLSVIRNSLSRFTHLALFNSFQPFSLSRTLYLSSLYFLLVKIKTVLLVDIILGNRNTSYQMHATTTSLALLAAISSLIIKTRAHSWIEQMQVISDNGSFTGNMGYARGYMARTDPGYNGDTMDYLVPALETGRTRINSSDLLCHPSQLTSNYTSNYPMLQVSPGGYVSMKYLENGHVTLPQNQAGKPKAAGTIFVYGSTQPKNDEKIVDVLAWSHDGTGGDGRGSLLAAQNFDDGRCHQINSGAISTQRQQQFPDRVPDQPTSNVEQWCETDLEIPSSAAPNSRMTLYWIWQWPTAPGVDPIYPNGKDEYYTTCADIESSPMLSQLGFSRVAHFSSKIRRQPLVRIGNQEQRSQCRHLSLLLQRARLACTPPPRLLLLPPQQ